MRKIAVNGVKGRLGSTLMSMYPGCYPLHADITNLHEVEEELARVKPDTVIHCAAYTDVDGCENNQKKAYDVNMTGCTNVRKSFGGQMILVSTVYVFDGKKGNYKETRAINPINVYGNSKAGAEMSLSIFEYPDDVIVRTTMLYGSNGTTKPDFVRRLLGDYFAKIDPISMSTKLRGNPTHVEHLAKGLMDVVNLPLSNERANKNLLPRIINIAGEEILSRYEFSLMIADVFGLDKSRFIPKTSPETFIATRPENAGLNIALAKKLGIIIKPVHEGLELVRAHWN